jgi:predicted dehydrogenase
MTNKKDRTIRLGVFGSVKRGLSYIEHACVNGFELTALCDKNTDMLREADRRYGVRGYENFEEFLTHDMDAVVLANYFHQHAPYAVQCLKAGLHVLSECTACGTMAEGVALIDAVEAGTAVYMLAENYPYMRHNQEMRKIFRSGEIGSFKYGEGEYVHPDSAEKLLKRSPGMQHWRNWIPATYYCTHSLAPVMYITDSRVKKVNAFVVPKDFEDQQLNRTVRKSDTAGIIICRMDNGAVVKLIQGQLRGHRYYVRIHGNKGLMENLRVGDEGWVRIKKDYFDKEKDEPSERIIMPELPLTNKGSKSYGHGGSDFYTSYYFARAIREQTQPYFNVYRAVEMSAAGILGYRSALSDGAPITVPNMEKKAEREKWKDDEWTPDPEKAGPNQPPPSILGNIEPDDHVRAYAEKIWSQK